MGGAVSPGRQAEEVSGAPVEAGAAEVEEPAAEVPWVYSLRFGCCGGPAGAALGKRHPRPGAWGRPWG